jgi:uncharacterized membrane protein
MRAKGMLIASAAAGLIIGGAVLARADEKTGGDMVHCAGVNACKGQGECSGAGHSCGGKNGCKGQGWVETSKAECAKKGGKVVEPEKK